MDAADGDAADGDAAGLGSLPQVALLAALGLVTIAVSDTLSRFSIALAPVLWWVGLLVIVLPVGARLLAREVPRPERLSLVVLVGLALYLVKILGAPSQFQMLDEFLHWATLDDIVVGGRLFTPNSILLASPYYPGLEVLSDLLVRTGFSTWEAGVVIVGIARVLLMVSLFLLYERASGDARLAGVGALVYAANPGFLFFDAQFAYESLGLPIAVFVLWCVQRREVATGALLAPPASLSDAPRLERLRRAGHPVSLTVVMFLSIAALVVTHHVTALALSACLVVWAVVGKLLRHRGNRPGGVLGLAIVAVIATAGWMLYVASVTVGYLLPALGGAVDQVLGLIAGDEAGRQLFQAATGTTAPVWEQLVGYGSVLLMLLALPIALPLVWRRWRHTALPITLGLIALLYPASMLARLTTRGSEIAARSAEFIFVGGAFATAIALLAIMDWAADRAPRTDDRRVRRTASGLVMAALVVLFMGGAVLGIAPWARQPGPFLVAADPRSISPQGIGAASWTLAALGEGHRFLSDRTDRVLLATYGRQHPLSATGDQVNLRPAYFDTTLSPSDQALLTRTGVDYVIADHRLPTSLPYVGVYVERGESSSGPWTSPMPAAALDKWASLPGADTVYDNGAIQIVDIRRLTGRAQ